MFVTSLTIEPGDDRGLHAGDEEQAGSTGAVDINQLKENHPSLTHTHTVGQTDGWTQRSE